MDINNSLQVLLSDHQPFSFSMDPQSPTSNADRQPLFSTDAGNFIPWSPSNEFFGQEFNTAMPFSPNELVRFCNALTSEAGIPELKPEKPSNENLKHSDSGEVFMGSEQAAEPETIHHLQRSVG